MWACVCDYVALLTVMHYDPKEERQAKKKKYTHNNDWKELNWTEDEHKIQKRRKRRENWIKWRWNERERKKEKRDWTKKTERHVHIYFCPLNETRIAKKYARKQKQQQQRQLQQQQQQHQNQQQTNWIHFQLFNSVYVWNFLRLFLKLLKTVFFLRFLFVFWLLQPNFTAFVQHICTLLSWYFRCVFVS